MHLYSLWCSFCSIRSYLVFVVRFWLSCVIVFFFFFQQSSVHVCERVYPFFCCVCCCCFQTVWVCSKNMGQNVVQCPQHPHCRSLTSVQFGNCIQDYFMFIFIFYPILNTHTYILTYFNSMFLYLLVLFYNTL